MIVGNKYISKTDSSTGVRGLHSQGGVHCYCRADTPAGSSHQIGRPVQPAGSHCSSESLGEIYWSTAAPAALTHMAGEAPLVEVLLVAGYNLLLLPHTPGHYSLAAPGTHCISNPPRKYD